MRVTSSTLPQAIEDIYPLSPMQRGMLSQTLLAAGAGPGAYFKQFVYRLRGDLAVQSLEHAWQQAIARHSILRSAFIWEGVDRPVQVVFRDLRMPLTELDWRAVAPDALAARLEAFLRDDRERGFDLARAPLLRLTLARVADAHWYLIWTGHHLVLDGWSALLLVEEVVEAYEAHRLNRPRDLPPAPPYRDYISWLERQDTEAAERFWRRVLDGVRGPTPLPEHRSAPAGPDALRRDERELLFSAESTAAIRHFARAHQLTIGAILQGAWALLLHRYSGERDIVFGATVSGRPPLLDGIERMVGLFINTLPVRVRIDRQQRLQPWLAALQREQAEARQYDYVPLTDIQRWTRTASGQPLFESVLVVENYRSRIESADARGTPPASAPPDEQPFDVRMVRAIEGSSDPLTIVASVSSRLALRALYSPHRFADYVVAGLLAHLRELVEAMCRQPDARLADLEPIPPHERRQLVSEWNRTDKTHPRAQCVHELFAARAVEHPDTVAAIGAGGHLTYEELDRRANRVAAALTRAGVAREGRVGLCVERNVDMLAGILGILKAGAAYVPLDPAYPAERLGSMIEDSAVRWVITHATLRESLPQEGLQFLCVEETGDVGTEAVRHAHVAPQNAAYVMYTSGSTGRPKGVIVTHAAVTNLVLNNDYCPVGPHDRVAQIANISFDAATFEIWTALLNGGCVVCVPYETAIVPADFERLLRQEQVTSMFLTTSLFNAIARERPACFAETRDLVVGGEALDPRTLALVLDRGAPQRLVNGYGPTETTTFAAWSLLSTIEEDQPIPIGRGLGNVQLFVLSRDLDLLPAGVEGELHIAGEGLARGYLNRPDLTAERFVPHPYARTPGARLYRSGDRVRWRPDGQVAFLGRIDRQVKIRGFRIEPQEIEAVLMGHPDVHLCSVLLDDPRNDEDQGAGSADALADGPLDRRLVAYIEPRQEALEACDTDLRELGHTLRSYLEERLPPYMRPQNIRLLDRLPLDVNGKIDRRALRALAAPAPAALDADAEPRTPLEELLAGIFAELLHRPQVGREDDFFDLGGHSLLAMQALSRIREAVGLEVPFRALFEAPTAASLAGRIEALRANGTGSLRPPLTASPGRRSSVLSFAQQRLWFLDRLEPGRGAYTIPLAVRVAGPLDLRALARSLDAVVDRHETLRTRFVAAGGEPMAIVEESLRPEVRLVSLEALEPDARDACIRAATDAEAARGFDLSRGPLLRVLVARLCPQEHVLLLTMHHIVSDGWSLEVLVRELGILYESSLAGRPSPLPPLAVQYADYARWQRDWLQGDVLARQLAFWTSLWAAPSAPVDWPMARRPELPSHQGDLVACPVPGDISRAVTLLSRRQGATVFMTLLATLATLLSRYTGRSDVAIGTPVAGRSVTGTEPLIGLFVNTLALRVDVSDDPPFTALLARVRALTLDAFTHQDVPFERVVDAVQPQRSQDRSPLFQVMFVLQNTPPMRLELPHGTLTAVPVQTRAAMFDLGVVLDQSPDRIGGVIHYKTDLFDRPAIERLATHFVSLLRAVVADPLSRLSALPLLSAAERAEVLRTGSYAGSIVVHETLVTRFEAQVGRTPDAVAIVHDDDCLTYAALDARANQLARHLASLGIGPESRVGLCVDRSADLVVAILGIAKTGGAYVPVEPGRANERLTAILEDAQCGAVVTEERFLEILPAPAVRTVCVDGDAPAIRAASASPLNVRIDPQQAAYVIYTSGSTGTPKGVVVTHANVGRLFAVTEDDFGFDASDVWTLFHSAAFDFSVWELWGALLFGGRLIVVSYLASRSPDAFYALVRREQVTVLNQTPSAFRQFAQADRADAGEPPLALRWIVFGGEALDVASLRPWYARHPGKPRLVNMYGITETTVHVTIRPLAPRDADAPSGSPIGGPLADLQCYVLDARLEPVPIGFAGELYVGGAGLARGYLRQPALTAARFLPDPFGSTPGARLYRTGDRVRWSEPGAMVYEGRVDQQIKIRGFRIEPAEIALSLRQHPAVRDAIVLARDEGDSERRLVAYVELETGADTGPAALRAFLRQRLPDFMLPAAFVAVDRWPLTVNGKLDRDALPLPTSERPDDGEPYVPPRTPVEAELARIWADVLQVDRVGIHDNFFDLGGDSMLSVRLCADAEQAGLVFSVQHLFQAQTIAALAAAIDRPTEAASEDVPDWRTPMAPFALLSAADRARVPPAIEDAYPLARLQAGMLFHSDYTPGTALYHDIFSMHLRVTFDEAAVRQALRELVAAHPVLRTSFDLSSFDEPLQLVHRKTEVPLEIHDVSALDEAAQSARLSAWQEQDRRRPFDWTRPPLLRFCVHRHSADTFHFSFVMHHAILDGWSVASMLAELFTRYLRLIGREDLPPPAPAANLYPTFVALERQAIRSDACRRYWTSQLSGREATLLARPTAAGAQIGQRVVSLQAPVAPELLATLKQHARAAGVTLKSVLLAAHLRTLGFLTGQRNPVTGLVTHGRPEMTDGDRALGLFLNTVPFGVALGESSWLTLVVRTFEAEREMLPFRWLPLAELQQAHGGVPLFDTAFNYTHFHVYESIRTLDELELLAGDAHEETNLALVTNASLSLDGEFLVVRLDYDASRISAAHADQFRGAYLRTLEAVATAPDAAWSLEDLLTTSDRESIRALNRTNVHDSLPALCVQDAIAGWAERAPDARALVFGDGHLTYAALNGRANRLASVLRARGIGPGARVAVCLERGPELVVALLGVLKAGAAYVPLDPSHPVERLARVLDDSAPALIVASGPLPERDARLLTPAEYEAAMAEAPDGDPVVAAHPSALAYVIYTSGSTGRPKGVAIEHRALTNVLDGVRREIGFGAEDVLVAVTTVSFDIAGLELWLPLVSGGCVILASQSQASDGERLQPLLAESEPTMLQATPTTWRLLRHAGWTNPQRLRMLCGGEALARELADDLLTLGGELWNMYGPTETTIWSSWSRVQPALGAVPIGPPCANTQFYVLDENGMLAPSGAPGALYIGGSGLARGYWRRADLTAARFVPDAFAGVAGARLYDTGDQACWHPDGTFDFLGRRDHQIKIRGLRIELGEIEAALAEHPAVANCVVTTTTAGPDGDAILAAYWTPKDAAPTDADSPPETAETFRRHLHTRVPDYMVPHVFVKLAEMPLTPAGKIDRRALPAPTPATDPGGIPRQAPRDDTEAFVRQVWERVLGTPDVGTQDDFFALGGHSIKAVELAGRISRAYGAPFPVRWVFDYRTVEAMARVLRQQVRIVPPSAAIPLQGRGTRRPLFCVHPLGGLVHGYVDLARHLGPDQPFYGLQSQGLDDDSEPLRTVAGMAAHYIAAMRAVQPTGPYQIAGWSMGAVVAYEIARQLAAAGDTPSLVALLDGSLRRETPPPSDTSWEAQVGAHRERVLAELIRDHLGIPPEETARLAPEARTRRYLEGAKAAGRVPDDVRLEQFERFLTVMAGNAAALVAYEPAPYAGRVLLFRSTDADGELPPPALMANGFDAVALGGVEIIPLPAPHAEFVMAPYAEALAGALRGAMDAAEERVAACVTTA